MKFFFAKLSIIAMCLMCVAMIFQGPSLKATDFGSQFLKSFELFKIEPGGQTEVKINEGQLMRDADGVRVAYEFVMPNGHTVQPGDTSTVKIPEALLIHYDQTIDLFDQKNNAIAKVIVKKGDNTLNITYLDAVNKVNDIRGSFRFSTGWNQLAYNQDGIPAGQAMDVNLEMPMAGTIQDVELQQMWSEYSSQYEHAKFSEIQSETATERIINWRIAINTLPIPNVHENVVVTDTLGEHQSFNDDIKIFLPNNVEIPTSEYDVTLLEKGFEITFKQTIDTKVEIKYSVTTTDYNVSSRYYNDYHFRSNLIDEMGTSWTTLLGNGGNVATNEGLVFISKQDAQTKELLSGAEFSLYKSSDELIVEKLTTDNNGHIGALNLLYGDYYLVETKAPKGYQLSKEKITFTLTSANNATAYKVVVFNTKEVIKEEASNNNTSSNNTSMNNTSNNNTTANNTQKLVKTGENRQREIFGGGILISMSLIFMQMWKKRNGLIR